MLKFPEQFLWGAHTVSHKHDGDNTSSDWWQAEQNGLLGHTSGKAVDHWQKFGQDYLATSKLNHNAHLFNLEWARLEPQKGQFDPEVVAHYRQRLLYLREAGLEPIVCLHHFSNPTWFNNQGGWSKRGNLKYWQQYVKFCAEHFGDYVTWWVTLADPLTYARQAYLHKHWPIFDKSLFKFFKSYWTLHSAHKQAYKILKTANPDNLVGFSHKFSLITNLKNKPSSRLNLLNRLRNHLNLKFAQKHFDFIALGYQTRRLFSFFPRPKFIQPSSATSNSEELEIYPLGLLTSLQETDKYRCPVILTELNLNTSEENQPSLLLDYLLILYIAIAQGIDVRGYLAHSLLDGYEWQQGFVENGLIEVSLKTQKRRPRHSALFLAQIFKQGFLTEEQVSLKLKSDPSPYPSLIEKHLQKIIRFKPN